MEYTFFVTYSGIGMSAMACWEVHSLRIRTLVSQDSSSDFAAVHLLRLLMHNGNTVQSLSKEDYNMLLE